MSRETETSVRVWPRVYRAGRVVRGFYMINASVAWIGAAACAVLSLLAPDHGYLVFGIGLLFAGAFAAAKIFADRVLLYEDHIEFIEIGLPRRRIRREQIAFAGDDHGWLVLGLCDPPGVYRANPKWAFDECLLAWLSTTSTTDMPQ